MAKKINTGISLTSEAMQKLRDMAKKQDRSYSWIINNLIMKAK